MNTIVVNGEKFEVFGSNVSIVNDKVIVNGKTIKEGLKGIVKVEWEGDLADLNCNTAEVKGNVGTANCNTLNCNDIKGNVDANSVNCRDIHGSVDANSVRGNIKF